jgi:hypothetical protein
MMVAKTIIYDSPLFVGSNKKTIERAEASMARSTLMHRASRGVRWYANYYPSRESILLFPRATQFLAQAPLEAIIHLFELTGRLYIELSKYSPHEWVIVFIQQAPVATVSVFLSRFFPKASRGTAHHVTLGLSRRSPADIALFAADPTLLLYLRMGQWASLSVVASMPGKFEHVNAFLALPRGCGVRAGGTADITLIRAATTDVTRALLATGAMRLDKYGASAVDAAAQRHNSEQIRLLLAASPAVPITNDAIAYARRHDPALWAELWNDARLRPAGL